MFSLLLFNYLPLLVFPFCFQSVIISPFIIFCIWYQIIYLARQIFGAWLMTLDFHLGNRWEYLFPTIKCLRETSASRRILRFKYGISDFSFKAGVTEEAMRLKLRIWKPQWLQQIKERVVLLEKMCRNVVCVNSRNRSLLTLKSY